MNTLQKTLLLKKKAELDQVDEQLTRKRDEFKNRMEDLAHKRSELKLKQQQVSWNLHKHTRETQDWVCITVTVFSFQNKETMMRFEKFVDDNEVKRSRALKKYEAAQEENVSKQSEIEELTEELKRLKVRWGRYSKTHLCLWSGIGPKTGILFYRQQVLKEKIEKYKIYEDYLLKTLDYFPSSKLASVCSPS